jgi:hypothetical protein
MIESKSILDRKCCGGGKNGRQETNHGLLPEELINIMCMTFGMHMAQPIRKQILAPGPFYTNKIKTSG